MKRYRFPVAIPLAFSESNARLRVGNVLNFRRPKTWIVAASLMLCLTVLLACAANPVNYAATSTITPTVRPNDQATKEQLIKKIESMQLQPAGEVKFMEVIGTMDAVHAGAYSFVDDLFEYTARGDNQFITTILRKGSPEESPTVVRSQLEMDQLAINLFKTNFASLPLKTVTRKVIRNYSGLYMVEIIELLDEQTQSGLKASATFTSDGQLTDMTFITSRMDKVPAESIHEEQARVKLISYMEATFLNKPAYIGGDVVKAVYDQSSDPYGAYKAEYMTFNSRVSWHFTLPIIIDTTEGRIYKTAIQANIDVTSGALIGGVAKAAGYRIVK